MSIAQLKVAMSLEANVSEWHDFAGDLRFLCGSLVRFQDEQVYLIHETARDFLQDYASKQNTTEGGDISLDILDAENELASVCVTYLLKEDTFSGFTDILQVPSLTEYLRGMKDFLQKKPFLSYAARYWVRHLHSIQQPRSLLSTSVLELLQPEWRRDAVTCLTFYFTGRYSMPLFPTCSSGLHLAGWYNLPWLVDLYLEQGMCPDVEASSNDSPLVWASETGGAESVEKLLRAGANPSKAEYDGWTALHWAATNGHEQVARLLLQAGANPDAEDSEHLCPIDWAAEKGHWGVVNAIQQQKMITGKLASADLVVKPLPLRHHSSQSSKESERTPSRRPSFLIWDISTKEEVLQEDASGLAADGPTTMPKQELPSSPLS
jgi:hypothetical protein